MSGTLTHKITGDGSSTLFHAELNEHYHSIHGAYSESMHVFINSGLNEAGSKLGKVKVLEIGFGTGLNAWLSAMWATESRKHVHFTSIEYHPLSEDIINQLSFPQLDEYSNGQEIWKAIHQADWEGTTEVSPYFTLRKCQINWIQEQVEASYDVIYYDAFAPDKQPEMWTNALFKKAFDLLNEGGVLVTYTAKGDVRRTMQAIGFTVEKIPGPPGKREMLRAWKTTG